MCMCVLCLATVCAVEDNDNLLPCLVYIMDRTLEGGDICLPACSLFVVEGWTTTLGLHVL